MIVTKFKDDFLLKLEQHEEFIRELKKFCLDNNIKNASFTALGAINSVTLGFYDTQTQLYHEQSFHKPFELTSASGTITTVDDDLITHVHATISDKDFRTYGGHLFRAVASKTIEILLRNLD